MKFFFNFNVFPFYLFIFKRKNVISTKEIWQDPNDPNQKDKEKRVSHGLNHPAFSIEHLLMQTEEKKNNTEEMENSCNQENTNTNAP